MKKLLTLFLVLLLVSCPLSGAAAASPETDPAEPVFGGEPHTANGSNRQHSPVMTGYGDRYLLYENGRGYLLDAEGRRTELDAPCGAVMRLCIVLEDVLYWQASDGSVYRSGDLKEHELLLRNMPPLAGVVPADHTVQIVFSDGTIYDTESKEKTNLPVEGVVIGAEANEYMTVLAEENGTLWIRKTGEDFEPFRYDRQYRVRVRLTDITAMENTVYICGEKADGSPLLSGSVMGGVWLEREIAVLAADGTAALPSGIPLCMTAAEEIGALVLGFSDGTAAVLPSCVKCSAVYRLSDAAVTDIEASGGALGYIADGGFHVIPLSDIPQNENPEKDCPTGC